MGRHEGHTEGFGDFLGDNIDMFLDNVKIIIIVVCAIKSFFIIMINRTT